MSLEIDHVFCFCDPTLPEVKILEENGFILSSGKIHQGQGTANRAVVFESNFLELIYLKSEAEALTNPLKMHLRADHKTTGASPFGIALRGELSQEDLSQFWDYSPPYNPSRIIKMHKYSKEHPEFPLLFVMPTVAGSTNPIRFKDFQPHKSGSSSITKIKIETPFPIFPLNAEIKNLHFERTERHKVEVHVDGLISRDIHLNEYLSIIGNSF